MSEELDLTQQLYAQVNEAGLAGKTPEDKDRTERLILARALRQSYMIVKMGSETHENSFIRMDPDPQWIVINVRRKVVVDSGFKSYAEAAEKWYGISEPLDEASFASKTPEDLDARQKELDAEAAKAREEDKEKKWYKVTKIYDESTPNYEAYYVRGKDEDDAISTADDLYDPDEQDSGDSNSERVDTDIEEVEEDDVPKNRLEQWKKYLAGQETSIYEALAGKTEEDNEDTLGDKCYAALKRIESMLRGSGMLWDILLEIKKYIDSLNFMDQLKGKSVKEALAGKSDADKEATRKERGITWYSIRTVRAKTYNQAVEKVQDGEFDESNVICDRIFPEEFVKIDLERWNNTPLNPHDEHIEEAFAGKSDEDKAETEAEKNRTVICSECGEKLTEVEINGSASGNFKVKGRQILLDSARETFSDMDECTVYHASANCSEQIDPNELRLIYVEGMTEKAKKVDEAFGFAGKTEEDKANRENEIEAERQEVIKNWNEFYTKPPWAEDKKKFDALVKKFCDTTGLQPKLVFFNPAEIDIPHNVRAWNWGYGHTYSGIRTHAYALKIRGQADPMWVYSTAELAEQIKKTIEQDNLQSRWYSDNAITVLKRLTIFTYEAMKDYLNKKGVKYQPVPKLDAMIQESVHEALGGKSREDKEETARQIFICPHCGQHPDLVDLYAEERFVAPIRSNGQINYEEISQNFFDDVPDTYIDVECSLCNESIKDSVKGIELKHGS